MLTIYIYTHRVNLLNYIYTLYVYIQGLKNYTTWIRYGEFGYPMPAGTAHAAKCTYSEKKVLCPIPKTCPDSLRKYNIII